jgi:hypothetical protein
VKGANSNMPAPKRAAFVQTRVTAYPIASPPAPMPPSPPSPTSK